MFTVETRLKRLENRLRAQRFLNLILLLVAAVALFQEYLPASILLALRKNPMPKIVEPQLRREARPAPVLHAQAQSLDVETLKTRRLSITDKNGRERMTLLVDANDSPFVIVKDEEGRFRATMAVQMDGRGAFGLWNTEKKAVHGVIEPKPETLEISQVKND